VGPTGALQLKNIIITVMHEASQDHNYFTTKSLPLTEIFQNLE